MSKRTSAQTQLVFATSNLHKLGELCAILKSQIPDFTSDVIASMSDFAVESPVEDGASFSDNALIKARALRDATGIASIADDSGLCVEIMGGAPGIFSARWSGTHGNDEDNLNLLLAQLSDVPDENRGAAFTCAAALALPDGREYVEVGSIHGSLLRERHGKKGFGYDPIFVPDGYDMTTAEMTAEVKNAISHRGIAFVALLPRIKEILSQP